MERFRPTVGYRVLYTNQTDFNLVHIKHPYTYLNKAGGNAGTRGHHGFKAAIMHYEVAY